MCNIIKIGDSVAIICGQQLDHKCNEDAVCYELKNGERKFFTDKNEERNWYDENYKEVISGSVACSICGHAAIDDYWKLEV